MFGSAYLPVRGVIGYGEYICITLAGRGGTGQDARIKLELTNEKAMYA